MKKKIILLTIIDHWNNYSTSCNIAFPDTSNIDVMSNEPQIVLS